MAKKSISFLHWNIYWKFFNKLSNFLLHSFQKGWSACWFSFVPTEFSSLTSTFLPSSNVISRMSKVLKHIMIPVDSSSNILRAWSAYFKLDSNESGVDNLWYNNEINRSAFPVQCSRLHLKEGKFNEGWGNWRQKTNTRRQDPTRETSKHSCFSASHRCLPYSALLRDPIEPCGTQPLLLAVDFEGIR